MKRNSLKLILTAVAAVLSTVGFAQTNLGAACGCPPIGSRTTTVLMSTLAVPAGDTTTEGNLLASTVLTCDKIYILDKKIWVLDGQTLTIQPGTLIKGREVVPATKAASLIITRGGKIIAPGTQDCPIVFTAELDPMDGSYSMDNRKKWGGVLLLGRAKNNIATGQPQYAGTTGVGFIEGFLSAQSRNLYGMPTGQEDDNDNSGIMTYVSIRHGGAVVGSNNEINGLTLGSVGRATTLHHIEVLSNEDDGIEFFGGTVDLKYGVVMFNDDDGFDWDQGWRGKGQFWFVLKLNTKGDNGFECDGDDGASALAPISHPKVYNATCIGDASLTDSGIEAKELTEGEIYNSIFAQYQIGFNLYNTRATDAYNNWITGSLIVKNNTFIGCTDDFDLTVGDPTGSDATKFTTTDGNVNAASASGFDFTFAVNTVTNAITDQYDAIPNPALSTNIAPPTDGFFSAAPYRGAFPATGENWMEDWTYASFKQTTAGLSSLCVTDINNDGVTNNADFLILLGEFNQSCE